MFKSNPSEFWSAVLASMVCASLSQIQAGAAYQQRFTGAGAMSDIGWRVLAVDDSTGKNADVSEFTVQAGVSGGTSGYGFFAPHLGRGADAGLLRVAPGLFFTEAPSVQGEFSALHGLGFAYSGDPVTAAYRLAVKVDGKWYAQAVPTLDSRDNPGPSAQFLSAVFQPENFAAADNWQTVMNAAVDAAPMSLGPAPDSDLSGTIQGLGLYLENATDHMRFDDFRVLKPVPKIFQGNPIMDAMIKAKTFQESQGRMAFDWLTGTFYTGVAACYEATGYEVFLDAAREWSASGDWSCGEEAPLNADFVCTAQTFLDVYFVDKDPKQIEQIHSLFEKHYFGVDTIQPNLVGHVLWKEPSRPFTGRNLWWWCDALYMAPPVMARLGQATGDKRYYELMHQLFWDTTDFLYDEKEQLFFRDERFFEMKTPSGKPMFWGRGNGWVIGGLVRTIDYIPENDPMRPKYIKLFQDMMARIVTLQGEDGLWRASLNDPAWFPMKESSGSSFFTFGLAAGINRGWLDRDTYLPAAEKGWQGLLEILSPEGKVQWSQPVADHPFATSQDDTRSYTQGAFLLAAAEIYKLRGLAKQGQDR